MMCDMRLPSPAKNQASLGCALAVVLALAGCVSPNVKVDRARTALRSGNDAAALAWSEDLRSSMYSRDLGYLEIGRIRMLGGDFEGSMANLAAAIDTVIEQTEEGPRLKLGDMGANIMAGTITDDRTRPYRLPPYEFIHALNYQMLNRVFLGDPYGAAIEARRAVFAQDQIAEKYGLDVSAARDSVPKDKEAGFAKVDAEMAKLNDVVNLTRSSYENPLAWWLCGIFFEHDNDTANARLAYQKAHDLMPGNPFIQRDWLRALRREDPETFREALTQTGIDEASLAKPETELVLVFEEGFVPQRLSKKIAVPILSAITSVDFPVYDTPAHLPAPVTLADGGATLGASATALNIQSLAYRDLKEKMPGIVTRNITRAALRVTAAIAAKEAARHDSSGVGSLIQLIVFSWTGIASIANRADTRAWYTLPVTVRIWRGAVGPGEHLLELRNPDNDFTVAVPVTLARGETRILWVADTGGNTRAASAPLNTGGEPPAFGIYNSVLSTQR